MESLIPQERKPDSSIDLMKEGYLYIKSRVDRYHSDLFRTRLLMQKVICMSGREAAEVFYNPALFQRSGAAPRRVQKTLFGENAVQSMDGRAHAARKRLFLLVAAPERQKVLEKAVKDEWRKALERWEGAEQISLFEESKIVLCRAACRWAGVPLKNSQVQMRAGDFGAMVDAFGAAGIRFRKGKSARMRTEKWIGGILQDVRLGRYSPPEDSALHAVAFYEEPNGKPLDTRMAAIELINVLRPIVAISTYIVFAALAMHEHPECREKLHTDGYSDMFVQEIRRFYPFTPFVGARVKKDFVWNQCHFQKGRLVLLDVYGTDHDSRIWDHPDRFQPKRFRDRKAGPFDFIPQGGGKAECGHRCPGEGITVGLMKVSLDFLVNEIEYDVPVQDLSYSLGRMPALPKSGFLISNIRRRS